MLPVITANLAAQGAQGLVAVTLIPMARLQDQSGKDLCTMATEKGISVGESLETAAPADEGMAKVFEPAYWRLEWAREGYPQFARDRTPAEGTLAITDRSLFFAPLAGAASIRIPYELVQEVDVERVAATGEVRSLVVKSCFGRFDIVTFRQRPGAPPDIEMTNAAVTEIKVRTAAFLAAADR